MEFLCLNPLLFTGTAILTGICLWLLLVLIIKNWMLKTQTIPAKKIK